jgi:hypothetical protein
MLGRRRFRGARRNNYQKADFTVDKSEKMLKLH